MPELLSIAIVGALFGNAIAHLFPPVQRIKDRLGIGQWDYEQMIANADDPTMQPTKLKRLLGKALNCSPCCSFWSCIAIACVVDASAILIAPAAYVLGAMIDRMSRN